MLRKTLRFSFTTLLLFIQLTVVWSTILQPVMAQPSDTAPTLSENCTQILNLTSLKSQPTDAFDANDGEIYAILGESIAPNAPNDAQYNCSQIISCLQQKYFNSNTRDTQIINDIKTQYSYCLVAGKDGIDLLSNYASMVYQWIAGIVGGICILIIVFSGIQISMGGLSQEEVSSAKDRIGRSLGGLVILFLSAFILYTINPLFFT